MLQFSSESEVYDHVANGDHRYATAATGMDKAIVYYANQKHILNQDSNSYINESNDMVADDDLSNTVFSTMYVNGWARKVRSVTKISSKQREFITKLFLNGANSRTKLSAEQMAERMKEEMVDGNYYFSPGEYMDPKRIRNLISTLKRKQQTSSTIERDPERDNADDADGTLSEDEGIERNLESICDSMINDSDEELEFYGFDVYDIE